MATYRLPLHSREPHYWVDVDLEGTVYRLYLDWNDRDEAWYLSIELVDGTQLLDGRKLVLRWPLLRRMTDARRPPGEIMCIDTTGADAEPGRNDLGGRIVVLYIDRADVLAAVEG